MTAESGRVPAGAMSKVATPKAPAGYRDIRRQLLGGHHPLEHGTLLDGVTSHIQREFGHHLVDCVSLLLTHRCSSCVGVQGGAWRDSCALVGDAADAGQVEFEGVAVLEPAANLQPAAGAKRATGRNGSTRSPGRAPYCRTCSAFHAAVKSES